MMPPEPPVHPKPKPKRLPRREAVTIVAGFKTQDGIVLCADSQETVGGVSKRNVPKLRFEPASKLSSGSDLAAAFCGATDNGAFMDMLIDEAWSAAKSATSLQEACNRVSQSIKHTYREHVNLYQTGYMPSTELIYGVKMEGESRLFYGQGPAIHEKEAYATGGIGSYMADFLAARMYGHHLSVGEAVILAGYVLFQAKEHVAECGGDSQIVVLRNTASSGQIDQERTRDLTNIVDLADKGIGSLLLASANFAVSDEDLKQRAIAALENLLKLREEERTILQDWKDIWQRVLKVRRDDLGLPDATR